MLGLLISSFKGFASVLDLLFFGFHLPPLVRFYEFFEFSVFRFYEAMKAAAGFYFQRDHRHPHGKDGPWGEGLLYIEVLCRFVADYLQIVWELRVFCRLFVSFLSSVSVLILFNILGLNCLFTIGKECCSSRPWSSYESTLACYPDARKRFY